MTGPLKISVVTPCFNSAQTLRETILSVQNQTYQPVEHIVMDGGSKDGTLDILREFPHLIWTSEKDEGHYHAMNKGIERATGDVIVVLNADDCYRAGCFEKVAQAFAEHPDWDGLFGDVVFVDGQGSEIYRRREAIFDYSVLRYAFDYICHHTLFVKGSVYQTLGAYRHKLFRNAADYDFILRMARDGRRIGHVRAFLVNYRYHEFGQSLDLRIQQNTQREMQIVKREHGCPDGFLGRLCFVYGHARRQVEKLLLRGHCDIIPAPWILRRHMRAKTTFSSNSGLDELATVEKVKTSPANPDANGSKGK
jgi:glycosyltransferase involved in cell wall biosynthesis